MRRVHKIATVILALAGLCSAQNAASGEQEMIRLLAQQVKELQEKVTALEARSGSSGYVVYIGHGVEFMGEGFLIRHAFEQSNVRLNMPAFYSQISKKFGAIRPFVRYQYVNANVDSIFEDVLLRHGPSFGVHYEINENMAFKTQLDHTVRKGKGDLNGLHMQLAVTF